MEVELKFDKIVDGLLGAEGPVFTRNGDFYMVAPEVEVDDQPAGEVLKINIEEKKATICCKPNLQGYGGIPAGCQSDKNDNIWIADMRLGLLKVTPEGNFSQVTKVDRTGKTMQGCNDCIFDYDGNLWITAPAGDIAPAAYVRSGPNDKFGSVYCYTANGEMVHIDTGYQFSNGIAIKHDGDNKPKLLIVAETATKTLWSYNITGPGKVENKQKWAVLPGDHIGGPDGMDFDKMNNLLVANWGSAHIEVFSSDGVLVERIKCPFSKPSNLHFRPDSTELMVTEHDSHALWKTNWKYNGKKQYCEI